MNAAPVHGTITSAVGVCGLNVIIDETTKQNPMKESALFKIRCLGLRSSQTNRAPTANSNMRNGVRKKTASGSVLKYTVAAIKLRVPTAVSAIGAIFFVNFERM